MTSQFLNAVCTNLTKGGTTEGHLDRIHCCECATQACMTVALRSDVTDTKDYWNRFLAFPQQQPLKWQSARRCKQPDVHAPVVCFCQPATCVALSPLFLASCLVSPSAICDNPNAHTDVSDPSIKKSSRGLFRVRLGEHNVPRVNQTVDAESATGKGGQNGPLVTTRSDFDSRHQSQYVRRY